jgi:hypothetical protein
LAESIGECAGPRRHQHGHGHPDQDPQAGGTSAWPRLLASAADGPVALVISGISLLRFFVSFGCTDPGVRAKSLVGRR